ncbi:ABC transporter integral membrane type 1 [Penicillium malachiteum]|uniref:ABC transporter integral membrane type 1 n=1 Tax=Penicillium malachiteum TaxID=1324776 RepID=A0AAD6HD83_9EURO|nr:ABC transporter integral membrane type 1 [Penicillium malachiteum]
MNLASADVAYCPQSPWIMNSSIRANITGWSEFDEKWYDALAPAVYSRIPNVVLDDIFSGLDSQNTHLLGKNLFGQNEIFRRAGKTVIIATYTRDYNNKLIVYRYQRPEYKQSPPDKKLDTIDECDKLYDQNRKEIEESSLLSRQPSREEVDSDSISLKQNLARRNCSWSIYSCYAHKAGFLQVGLFATFLLACGFTAQFSSIWLEWWSDANERDPNSDLGKYLGVYTVITLLAVISLAVGCWMLIIEIFGNTSLALHSDLLKSVLSAPFSLFQETDSGAIMNRFSQDMQLIDFRLPVTALNFVEALSLCIVSLVILCVVGKYITIALSFILLAIWVLQHGYLRTSRQVRLLDIEAKALLFSQFQETRFALIIPRDTPILSDLSIHIPSGHKVAVCGPSGSGKTSIIIALLQVLKVSNGRITIDGVDISTIYPTVLCTQITGIPQDPFFLLGTLHESFNPTGTLSDERIVAAIQKVGLWNSISGKGGLDTTLEALDRSYGEKQLLALARALTTPSPLLILDEATSNVDWETEAQMLEIIEQECVGQTVIAVVHQLRHIGRFDSVALLSQGTVVEFDAPEALLGLDSEFRKLYTASQK